MVTAVDIMLKYSLHMSMLMYVFGLGSYSDADLVSTPVCMCVVYTPCVTHECSVCVCV